MVIDKGSSFKKKKQAHKFYHIIHNNNINEIPHDRATFASNLFALFLIGNFVFLKVNELNCD